MTNFAIKFISKEVEYTANVWKAPLVNNIPVQYHVSNIQPSIEGVPDPFMFIHNPSKKVYEYSIFADDPDLSSAILDSIKKYCLENSISLNT